MAASSQDYFKRVGKPGTATTLAAPGHTIGGTSITVASTTNWETGTGVTFAIDQVAVTGSTTSQVPGTYTVWHGVVTGPTTIASMTLATESPNADQNYSAGSLTRVYVTISAAHTNKLMDGILTHADQDGTLKADSVDVTAVIKDGIITNDKMATAVKPETLLAESTFDFVASGCVWSGDSYGSTRAASMTSGVVYINGRRVTVSAVTARTFTASKDTYIDVDNTGTITYTEVTTNAASPALTAGNIRLGIICTGATSIVNAGYINQGQENKTVPVASSIMYAVTDSLGNLICPRDPNRRILGQRQILAGQGSITTAVDITGLSSTVIVPTGRKVIVSVFAQGMQSSSTGTTTIDIKDGSTVIQSEVAFVATVTGQVPVAVRTPAITPTAGTHTYKVTVAMAGGGNGTFNASSTNPAYIMVELV